MSQAPKELVPHFFNDTAKTYDAIVNCTTFGQDKYWKEQIIEKIKNPNHVLELASGTGILTKMIANKFPHAKITGVDVSQSYLQIARQRFSKYQNISFIHKDAEEINLKQRFDCICSSYLPKYCDPETLIQKCVSHLNPEGTIILHDFIYPQNKLLRNLWNFYFKVLLFVGNFVPSWKFAFAELPKIIRKSTWALDYQQVLEKNGFEVKRQDLTWNTSTILFAKLA